MLRVAVVEDDALIALDVEMKVEEAGHVVVGVAASADEAVALAGATRPDVVVMDLRLAGGSSGLDAARRIRREYGIRCVFLSGNLDLVTPAAVAEVAPYALLSKPFASTQLARALSTVPR